MPHPVDVSVGQKLRELREAAGMTQVMLAKRVGTSFQQLQKYESGANRISASRLWELCQVLGARPRDFFVNAEPHVDVPAASGRGDEHAILTGYFARIGSYATRRRFVDLVKALAEREK